MLRDLWARMWSWLEVTLPDLTAVFDDDDDDGPYCVNGCGKPATHARPNGMWFDQPVTDLVCAGCARDD